MNQNMKDFFYGIPVYKQHRMDDEDDLEAETIKAENSAIKRALAMAIEQRTRHRDGKVESVRRQIEQAELDAIAADFEAEERKKRLEKMGAGSWA
ncbi:hypothetical protein CNR34_00107 [Pseudomonas phage nickie]|uniref:Uncharacterized protein n=1 Tax=Pseudomonas phage nickie TaxID=2048977 RepID=A0A2H4P7M5_9CAUD|nr:hypothetical protein FDJ16_gp058 [Pseudomonas phage nickie]ATW58040.1 hypothetical protein CNR34_00107 [Pseudomonas phage nickie]